MADLRRSCRVGGALLFVAPTRAASGAALWGAALGGRPVQGAVAAAVLLRRRYLRPVAGEPAGGLSSRTSVTDQVACPWTVVRPPSSLALLAMTAAWLSGGPARRRWPRPLRGPAAVIDCEASRPGARGSACPCQSGRCSLAMPGRWHGATSGWPGGSARRGRGGFPPAR
jgi:hypothetical protein